MTELHKRWGNWATVQKGLLRRCFLSQANRNDIPHVACIEARTNAPTKSFALDVWDFTTSEWDFVATFPTEKQAKTIGRVLAGIALANRKQPKE